MMSDWKNSLRGFFDDTEKAKEEEKGTELSRFFDSVVIPAFDEITEEMRKHGREVMVRLSESSAAMIVQHHGEEELSYRVQGRMLPTGVLPYVEVRFRQRGGLKLITVETMLRSGTQDYKMADISKEEVMEHFVQNYTQRAHS